MNVKILAKKVLANFGQVLFFALQSIEKQLFISK